MYMGRNLAAGGFAACAMHAYLGSFPQDKKSNLAVCELTIEACFATLSFLITSS